jgi:pterin-4a-carbinolamine dehydratase
MEAQKKAPFPTNFPIGPDPLPKAKLDRILREELTGWRVVESPLPENPLTTRNELFREYQFSDFDSVIAYINKVAVGCNIFPHHPRWENTWTSLRIYLTTWDITHIISYKDIMLARFMDKTYQEYAEKLEPTITVGRKRRERTDFIERIRKLVEGDELEEAFDSLSRYIALNPELKERAEFTVLTGRFNRFQKDKRQGLIPNRAEMEHTLAGITASLLASIKDL